MRLYVLDDETKNPLVCRTDPLDSDSQAERWVKDFAERLDGYPERRPTHFILLDKSSPSPVRCVWTRSAEDAAAKKLPEITKVAVRFTGEWPRSVESSKLLRATDGPELVALERHSRH